MKLLSTFFAVIMTFCVATAQDFRFDKNGKFKIMQLTDLHFTGADWKSSFVPEMLARMIKFEKPDLIVITGDVIFDRPGAALMYEICGSIASHGIPYAITLGNHDAEQGLDHAGLYKLIRTLPGCVNAYYNKPDERQGDFVIPVLSHKGDREDALIYIMDSNDYNADDHTYKGFTSDQVAWYRTQSAAALERNGYRSNGLLFFHVPLQEYYEAYESEHLAGIRLEKECPARDNTGMFRAIVERGEVIGTFVGHDHSNNYVAQKEGVALAYGHYSGGLGVYQHLLSGSRLIVLTEGVRGFETWVRLANLKEMWRVTFPKNNQ